MKKEPVFYDGVEKVKYRGHGLEVNIWSRDLEGPEEREEIIKNLQISREFGMRHRGLLEYYGHDFIAYKKARPRDEKRNEFLRIIAAFMSECLEDDCPPTWNECGPSFWEELLFTYFPHNMKISREENQTDIFLSELEKFVEWLDRRRGTSWHHIVITLINEARHELKNSEHLFNDLILRQFPRIHHDDWDFEKDIDAIMQEYSGYSDTVNSFFEINNILGDTVVIKDIDSHRSYQVKGLPSEKAAPGLVLYATIGKKKYDMYWILCTIGAVYPHRGQKYLKMVDLPSVPQLF